MKVHPRTDIQQSKPRLSMLLFGDARSPDNILYEVKNKLKSHYWNRCVVVDGRRILA
jgi:hypothetical protein